MHDMNIVCMMSMALTTVPVHTACRFFHRIASQGHVKLVDFGLAKEGVSEAAAGASSLCGTPEYLSPEVLDRQGHGTAVDWSVPLTHSTSIDPDDPHVPMPLYPILYLPTYLSIYLSICHIIEGGTWAW